MTPGKYTEQSALAMIGRNGCEVFSMKTLTKCRGKGLRVWGAIDFLVSHCGYLVIS